MKILLGITLLVGLTLAKTYCSPAQQCWPTESDLQELYNNLDPSLPRTLYWQGGDAPLVSPIPLHSPNNQPLYGLGKTGLKPLYIEQEPNRTCFEPLNKPFFSEYCNVSVRNYPLEGWTPAFTVWPVTPYHVQLAVKFAVAHNLCIMVAGTGHDFLNRHSCQHGFFIRTSLMKNIEWDLSSSQYAPDGKVKFGAGIVFSEAEKSASDYGRFVASGRCTTVGIVGWHIGGGRGFFGPGAGLGVDNILEAEIVVADGSLVVANFTQNTDLLWALRGGGGSNWGVITSLTVKAHKNPVGGFTVLSADWHGTMCGNSENIFFAMFDNYCKIMLSLDKRFAPVTQFILSQSSSPACNATWNVNILCIFQGPPTEPAFQQFMQDLTTVQNFSSFKVSNIFNWYEDFERSYSSGELTPTYESPYPTDGTPTVLISRETVANGSFAALVKKKLGRCKTEGKCGNQMLHQDLTGNIGSPQDDFVSISSGFRTALFNWGVYGGGNTVTDMEEAYTLGENSYFSESAYDMDGWQNRYWGTNYPRLQQIKQKYDPNEIFWCRHCVELPSTR